MKKVTLLLFMLSFTWLSIAQVGLNTITPDASSALDIESTTGGILIPRLSEFQRDAITLPATGLMIYQTDKNPGFYFYSGTAWTKINGAAGPQGVFGGASFEYKYGGIGPLLSDVGNGLVRFLDSDTQNSAMQLQFSELDINGSSVFSFIEMLSQTQSTTKGVVRLVDKLDSSKNLQFKITDIDFSNATGSSTPGYFIFNIENVASSSSNPFSDFASYTPVVMTYSISGSDGLQGPQGEQGEQGPEGLQGIQGIQGEQGVQGPIGVTGPSGQDGANGIDGDDGAQGQTGATGPTGPQGEQGIQGQDGPSGQDGGVGATGAQGPQGEQGVQGEQGIQGPIGLTGLTGPAGQDGANGLDGVDGAQGSAGETGVAGPTGPAGATGPQGPQGEQGIQGQDGPSGQDGAVGAIGEQGPQGEQGDQGDQGEQGIQGPIGVTGSAGQDGTNGIDGVDGQSAYQIWLSRGNTGTEEDFIASLTGPTGATGPQGAQGEQGEQGIQGPIGLTGLTGPAGQDGANGVDGVDGAQGSAGETGVAGPTGPAGATGPIGPQGEQGIQGQDGPSGQDGAVGATGEQGPQGDQGPQGPGGTGGVITREVGKIGFDPNNTPTATAVYYPLAFTSFETVSAGFGDPYQIWSYYETPEEVNNFAFTCNSTAQANLSPGTQFKLLHTDDYQSGIPTVIWSYTFPTATEINVGETLILQASNLQLPAGRYVWEATFPTYQPYGFILYITTQTSVMGAEGPQGPQGETGPAGATGVAGQTGPPGSQGAPGNDGIDGENGLSAYEIWINAGNTGTEADFLASLTGPAGADGVDGSFPVANNQGDMLYWDGSEWALIENGQTGNRLYYCDGVPKWGPCDGGEDPADPADPQIESESALAYEPNNYVRFANIPLYDNLSSITVEFWVFKNNNKDEHIIGTEYFDTGWSVNGASNNLIAKLGGLTVPISSEVFIPLGEWVHIVLQYDGSLSENSIKFFINGEIKYQESGFPGQIGDGGDIVINRHVWASGNSSRLSGMIDEVRISNIARYSENFTPSTNQLQNDNNTLLLLNFETTSSSSNQVIDSSDFQNHGNVGGEISYTPRN